MAPIHTIQQASPSPRTQRAQSRATPLLIHHFAATPDLERQLHALQRLLATAPAAPDAHTPTPATPPDQPHLPLPAGDEPLPTPVEAGGVA